jgi:hypothetical protein
VITKQAIQQITCFINFVDKIPAQDKQFGTILGKLFWRENLPNDLG